jgi:predicted ATPase
MIHLKAIHIPVIDNQKDYPFSLLFIRDLRNMEFTGPITFFVGENGSGKSTLLEAIACAVDSIVVGSESLKRSFLNNPEAYLRQL